jgi:hypothetical protein
VVIRKGEGHFLRPEDAPAVLAFIDRSSLK